MSPSPRSTTQRTSGSASNCAIAFGIARHISPVIALRRAGLSKTIQPMWPSRSARSFASLIESPQITLSARSFSISASA